MKAVVFEEYKKKPALKEVPKPTPGPGEVILKVAGSGACHSDVAVYDEYEYDVTAGHMTPPFILGHEVSGWVDSVGEGVTGVNVGDAYLVYGPTACGHCRYCSRGQDTYCLNFADTSCMAVGLGRDGGMAEYVAVPARNLVALGDADPIDAAPLADAGLTPYHAIKKALPELVGGGRTALVVGLGGLGMLGVQIIQALSSATVLVADMKPEAIEAAKKIGAIPVEGTTTQEQLDFINTYTGGVGVDAAFDFVGVEQTVTLAAQAVRYDGSATIVGIAGGTYEWNFYKQRYGSTLGNTYWGTIEDLHDVVGLYREGKIKTNVARYPLSQAEEAYRALREGTLTARAVIVPTLDE
ncbi:MAG: alcohol dehydrogenase catalytic domain-containing protein [Actinomycetaceae bacterium]|nr:alcohol dehydrogenase catalytic domain-containing protein [Actinomycetaceae bacterium]